jgi:hypothetical protein
MNTTSSFGFLALAVCAACGDDGSGTDITSDRDEIDAAVSVDAPTQPDATATGAITVTALTLDGLANPDAHVLFFDAAGDLIADVAADASGVATSDGAAGTSAVVIDDLADGEDGNATVSCYLGLAPGDEIVHQIEGYPGTIDVTATFPAYPGASSYTHHRISGRSDTATTSIDFPMWDATGNMAVVALDPMANVLGSLFVPDVAVSDGATLDLESLGGAWVDAMQTSIALVDIPAAATLSYGYLTSYAEELGEFDGNAIYIVDGEAAGPVADLPTGGAMLSAGFDVNGTSQRVLQFLDPGDAVDIAIAPKLITNVSEGGYNPATRTATWVSGASGEAPHATWVELYMKRPKGPALNWRITAPGDPGRMVLPALPAGYEVFALSPDDDAFIYGPAAAFVSDPVVRADLRRRPFAWDTTFPAYAPGSYAVFIFPT